MNDEIKRDRSPKAPVIPLTEAVELIKKLHSQIGRAKVDLQTACKALGYSGITGVTLSIIATLSQYQLINREQGQVLISPLAVRILHPTSIEQKEESLQEAAVAPQVFKNLSLYHDSSEDVIASHLIQNGFTPERAKRVARVFKANKPHFKHGESGIDEEHNRSERDQQPETTPSLQTPIVSTAQAAPGPARVDRLPSTEVLARYSIPLGENEATLVFTGKSLSPEDFTALIEYVELFKKQFERRQPRGTNPDEKASR